MADITIVNGVYKPTYNWGAPLCVIVPHKSHNNLTAPAQAHASPLGQAESSQSVSS